MKWGKRVKRAGDLASLQRRVLERARFILQEVRKVRAGLSNGDDPERASQRLQAFGEELRELAPLAQEVHTVLHSTGEELAGIRDDLKDGST